MCLGYFYRASFRAKYRKVNRLRAILSEAVVLAVTATATDSVVTVLCDVMGISQFEPIFRVSDRYTKLQQ